MLSKTFSDFCKYALFFMFVCFFSYLIVCGVLGYYHPAAPIAAGIFSIMVIEDYKQQTVDLFHFFTLLFLFGCMGQSHWSEFLLSFIFCFICWRVYYLAFIHIHDPMKINNENDESVYNLKRLQHGYLPWLAIAIVLVSLYLWCMGTLPFSDIIASADALIEYLKSFVIGSNISDGVGLAVVLLILLWLSLEWRLHSALHAGKIILYGFGSGDVYILAGFMSFLGFPIFMVVLFVSLLLIMIGYILCFLGFINNKKE